jgi:hypothetical protein
MGTVCLATNVVQAWHNAFLNSRRSPINVISVNDSLKVTNVLCCKASTRAAQAKTIWDTAQPVKGTVADHYLRGRGITCLLPSTLCFHGNC